MVQRGFLDWFKKKKEPVADPNAIPQAPEYRPMFGPTKPRGKPLTEKGQQVVDKLKSTPSGQGSFSEQLTAKRKSMGLAEDSSEESKAKLKGSLSAIEGEQQHRFKRDTDTGVNSKALVQSSQRAKLIHTLKNPNSTPEQMKAAEEKLRTFHKSGFMKKNPATIALKERKKSLKEAARGGDEKAAELYKKENPGFLTKAGNFFGKVGDFYGKHKSKFETAAGVLGKVGGMLGIGTADKKEEAKAPGGGGGGDGGSYAVIISQLMQENKMLKEQLAKK